MTNNRKILPKTTPIDPLSIINSAHSRDDIEFKIIRTNEGDNGKAEYTASLSSETLVDRWFGKERLIHSKGAVDLGRAKDRGLPLLFNHNTDEPIGKIRNIKVTNDKRLTGDLIFGNSQRAQEIEADVKDGLLDGVSIGYRINDVEQDSEDETIYNVTKWQLLEASIAPVPADHSVGVGRSQDITYVMPFDPNFYQSSIPQPMALDEPNEAPNVDDERQARKGDSLTETKKAPKMEPEINIQEIQSKAREAEQRRIREITALGDRFDKRDLAKEFINSGDDVESFRAKLLEQITPNIQPINQPAAEDAEIGMSEREIKQFSFARALAYLSDPQNRRMQEYAAFEIECSRAVEQKRGKPSSGIVVPNKRDWFVTDKKTGKQFYPEMNQRSGGIVIPYDVLTRDLSAGTATDGAELVSTDLLAGSFIDVLRNALVVRAAGATILTDLVGDVAIPRKTSGSSGGWIATEGGNAAQSDPQFDQVTLSPATCGVYTQYTRNLLLQSSLSIESLIRTDLAVGLATTIDLAALYGSGASGQPTGVLNTSGITTVTAFAGANPTFAEVITLETACDTSNALMGSLSYIMKANMKGVLKSTEKATNTAQFVYESDNTMNGYPVWITNQLTDGDLFFANWADLLIGMWGSLDLLVDPYTNSLAGTIRVVGHQSVDVAVRHPLSFAYGT